eukprot:1160381-Pelagomonas_calceolata.AAC.15
MTDAWKARPSNCAPMMPPGLLLHEDNRKRMCARGYMQLAGCPGACGRAVTYTLKVRDEGVCNGRPGCLTRHKPGHD